MSVIIMILLTTAFGVLARRTARRIKRRKNALTDIVLQFDYLSIRRARRYYIATQYQNATPSRQEEPGFTHQYIARNKLIPFFIRTAFDQRAEAERFYLILADSGMGKTTFMVNLYLRYHGIFNSRHDQKMKLLRFSDPETLTIVRSIGNEEAKRTILLLDALDEDRGIVSTNSAISDSQAFRNRIDEIIEITRTFAIVVITCRTQYFPGQEDDPYELKIRRPDERGFYTFNKLYISPLNNEEVKRYLRKKYGSLFFINRCKKKKAERIVNQAGNLLMRPMLLSYIDYFIDGKEPYLDSYNIYSVMVDKWLQREAEKRKGINDRQTFIERLEHLSQSVAVELYRTWKTESRLYLSKDETMKMAQTYGIQLEPQEITGQSLLTCDGFGNWKFSHKSIMEYFLAKELVDNPQFLKEWSFAGMDMTRQFYHQMKGPFIHVYSDTGSNSNGIYISRECIVDTEYDLIRARANESRIWLASVWDAMAYCNRMNSIYGYEPVYSCWGPIHKENYQQNQGFRLLTPEECKLLYQRKLPGNDRSSPKSAAEDPPGTMCYDGSRAFCYSSEPLTVWLKEQPTRAVAEKAMLDAMEIKDIEARNYALRVAFVP